MEPGHGVLVGEDEAFLVVGEGVGAFGKEALAEGADGFAVGEDALDLGGVDGVEELLAEEGNVDGVDVGIEDGAGEAGAGREFALAVGGGGEAGVKLDDLGGRIGLLGSEEEAELAESLPPTPPTEKDVIVPMSMKRNQIGEAR